MKINAIDDENETLRSKNCSMRLTLVSVKILRKESSYDASLRFLSEGVMNDTICQVIQTDRLPVSSEMMLNIELKYLDSLRQTRTAF